MDNWLLVLPLLGAAGLLADWWMSRAKQSKRNQRLDILHEVWRMLPVEPEFIDERNQPDQ